jgi:hypothetical protein
MDPFGLDSGCRGAATNSSTSRRERAALLDHVRRGQLGIVEVLERADTDPIVAKTDVRRLVEAFLWHADTASIVAVLIRAGVEPGRRVRGLAGWQRSVLISALN